MANRDWSLSAVSTRDAGLSLASKRRLKSAYSRSLFFRSRRALYADCACRMMVVLKGHFMSSFVPFNFLGALRFREDLDPFPTYHFIGFGQMVACDDRRVTRANAI